MKRGRDNVDVANCLMLLAKVGEGSRERVLKGGDFKCKTCNRQFHSFQALGGHRASHKKLKLMASNLKSCSTVTPKMHQCPICGLEFEIGQALGGHMRKHKGTTKRIRLCFDLNLTPYENDQNLDLRIPVLNLFI